MSNHVIVVNSAELEKIKLHYANARVTRNAPGVVFAAKTADTSITAYKSGKVLFQGAGAEREAGLWNSSSPSKSPKVQASGKQSVKLPEQLAALSVLGSDETGTGDFFGPVTVAACYVRADQVELVKELGVKDSKQLTDPYMRQIAPDLKAALIHSVLTVPNEKYNEIQARGWSQGKIKALLHNQALKHVLNKMGDEKPDWILIDQFAERDIYYRHIKEEKEIVEQNVLFSTKAEGLHVAVAAASILARVAFLDEMDRLSKLAGMVLPKGAGPKVDEAACRILMNKGEPFLQSITKRHFANTEKAKRLAMKKMN